HFCYMNYYVANETQHSFPTRRSSDLRTDKEDNQKRTAGYGVGRAYNERFPYVFMGATGTSKHSLDPSDENYFSGFIANTTKRESEEEIGNRVVGYRLNIRDVPGSTTND